MKIKNEILQNLIWAGERLFYLDKRRWETEVASIFKFEGKYYVHYWSEGNTECQEDDLRLDDSGETDCAEVWLKTVTKEVWMDLDDKEVI